MNVLIPKLHVNSTYQVGEVLQLEDARGKRTVHIAGVLGSGSSKEAVVVREDPKWALLLPRGGISEQHKQEGIHWWENSVVKTEMAMSNFLKEIGLLTPEMDEVRIIFRNGIGVKTFRSLSYQTLAEEREWYVYDCKNPHTSFWNGGFLTGLGAGITLFSPGIDAKKVENWDLIFAPALQDIAKLVYYKVPTPCDSVNHVVINANKQSEVSPYVIRYYGFDFSVKPSVWNPEAIGFSPPPRSKKLYLPEVIKTIVLIVQFAFFLLGGKMFQKPDWKKLDAHLDLFISWGCFHQLGFNSDDALKHTLKERYWNRLVWHYLEEKFAC